MDDMVSMTSIYKVPCDRQNQCKISYNQTLSDIRYGHEIIAPLTKIMK